MVMMGAVQATLVVFLIMILLVDLLFLDAKQFQYNPDYKVCLALRIGISCRQHRHDHSFLAVGRTGFARQTPSINLRFKREYAAFSTVFPPRQLLRLAS
jgi:hypothetical protein